MFKASKFVRNVHNLPKDHVVMLQRSSAYRYAISRRCIGIFLKVVSVSRKLPSYFIDQNTHCMLARTDERGQVVHTEPLHIHLELRLLSTEINEQYVYRFNFDSFVLTEAEPGLHMLFRTF